MVKKATLLLVPFLLSAQSLKETNKEAKFFNLGFTCGRIYEFRNANPDQADRILPDLLASCSVFVDKYDTEVQ